ncbi:MAG: ORF6N domain-containing protein, partial [Bacteroidota bacterium]
KKMMLDFDLAELYETETKRLKEAVRRNITRFPPDFMFELTKEEYYSLRTQNASSKRGGTRYMPFAFSEQGVAMLASVLSNPKAIEINIQIVRAFVFLRQYALSNKDITIRLNKIENRYNKNFKDIYKAINFLLQKDKLETKQNKRRRIGYKANNSK